MKNIPSIGLRIVKSAVAVFICYLVNYFRGSAGIVFYSQLSVLWCIQSYISTTKKNALQRLIGTIIGAAFGLLILLLFSLLQNVVFLEGFSLYLVQAIITSCSIILVLYTTVLLNKKHASYFSCVVFLSIVVIHSADPHPFYFAANRVIDTVIGIFIGVAVNLFHLPRKQHTDILFISGLDDTLLDSRYHLNDYCRVELNRMIDEGLHFTLSTMRPPASIIEPMTGIKLQIPVIAMDGAVLYDVPQKRYLAKVEIQPPDASSISNLLDSNGYLYFANVVIDDTLLIYYNQRDGIDFDDTQSSLYQNLRKSPYRNYIHRSVPAGEKVVYFMLFYPEATARSIFGLLQAHHIDTRYKVLLYPSKDYPGYWYIKIFDQYASKENMVELLKRRLKISRTVTFGTIPDRYDYVVQAGDTNEVVHKIKRLFESLF
ncbi:MAG: HAD hydrolase family protein [Treponemataceae bacterium]|nr:HAD hydrolase family protein [Treponemataceae bacterium]